MKNRYTPLYRRVFAVFGACLLMAGVMLTGAGPAAAAAPFGGEACAAGVGVTVAIDFAPGTDEVKVGCAAGSQATMGDAVTAAGFTYHTDATGLVDTVDGILVDTTKGFWSFYLNTSDGQPTGPLADTWTFAATGITGGPLAVDTVLLFDLVPDFSVQESPRITVADVTATAEPVPAPAPAALAPASVVGQACLPGQGVTVAVDYAPVPDALQIGCAVGAHQDMAAAGAAAGFTFTLAGTPQFLTGIGNNGYGTPVVETGTTALPNSFWSIYINTTNGQPAEPLTSDLTSALTGVDGGPLAIDTVLLFDFVPDYLANPPDTLRVTFADLGVRAPGDAAVPPPAYSASADGDALAAAGWVGRQLEANGGVLPGAGGTDYGLTIDAIFALAAAGVGGNDIATTAQAIYQSGTAYIGASADSAANAGKIAKTTLALQVAGLDPTVFPDGAGGTRNLPEELRLSMTPDGQFGPSDFPLVHSLAMLALARTSGGVPPAAIAWLRTAQCQDAGPALGGFGFSGCSDVDVDGTTLSVQALLAAGVDAADPTVVLAGAWLTANQGADGGMLSSFGAPNTNGTGLGGQTFLALGNTAAAASAGGFIGGLQVSCDSLVAGSLLTVADVGGISYDATGLQDANEFGIDSISVDQWRRASTQAILGLGLPAFDSITAAGANPELPAAPTCEPVVTTSPTTTVPTTATLATLTPVVATTPAGPQLVNTGVTTATLPMTMVGLVAILIGFGLVLIARRTRGGEHG